MLRRDGLLRAWSDHEIRVGDRFADAIDAGLERSGLFIALVSPDYLDSNYCYEKEFQRALELEAAGRLRIAAVILEPCDWLNSPISKLLVLPKDGKPVSEWTNENTAYLNVVNELRRVLNASPGPTQAEPNHPAVTGATAGTGRHLRLKQDFDAIQKAEFADQAYDTLKRYFVAACAELAQASDQIRTKFEEISPTAFTCSIVVNGVSCGRRVAKLYAGGRYTGQTPHLRAARAAAASRQGNLSSVEQARSFRVDHFK